MARLVLVIGDKRFSSWSLRAWLPLKQAGLAFEEIGIALRQPDTHARILEHSPSGKVPVLKDGELVVWDSLGIAEYAAELACAVPLWPENRGVRAVARSISAEMHAGFEALRRTLSMDLALEPRKLTEIPADAQADIARVETMWTDCRTRYGKGGDFLFGRWSVADAMYAPVATRFRTYGVALNPVAQAYVDATFALPAMQEWLKGVRRD